MKANQFIKNEQGMSNLLPIALAIVVGFALIFIGAFVNGEIRQSLEDSMPSAGSRSKVQNSTLESQKNITTNFDSSIDIVQIVIIITLLAAAIGAIFLFTRY
jgi:hypothetical protein